MKRIVGVFLAVAFCVSMCLTSVQPAAAAPLEIKFATQNPTAAWIHPNGYVPWAKKMEEATEGRLKVTIYPAQTLGKGEAFYDLVKTGVADMAFAMPLSTPGMFPIMEIFSLPLIPFKDAAIAAKIEWDLYNKYPAYQAEYPEVQILSLCATGPFFFASVNRPVKKLDDLKGMKIRVPGGRPADAFKAIGAVPTMVPMPEVYISLEKGIIDCATVPWEGPLGYLPLRSIKYWSEGWGLYNVPFFVIMNKDSWKKIGEKDQKILMEKVWGEYGSIGFSKAVWDDSKVPALKALSDNKIQIVKAEPGELEKWMERAKVINQAYVDELKAKKLPAQEIYDEAMKKAIETNK